MLAKNFPNVGFFQDWNYQDTVLNGPTPT